MGPVASGNASAQRPAQPKCCPHLEQKREEPRIANSAPRRGERVARSIIFHPWKKGGHICPVKSIPLKTKNANKVMDEHNSRRASRGGGGRGRSREVAGGLAAWNPRSCCSRSCEAALEGFWFAHEKKRAARIMVYPSKTKMPRKWLDQMVGPNGEALKPKHPHAGNSELGTPCSHPLLELELLELESRAWTPQARDINEAVAGRQKTLFEVQDLSHEITSCGSRTSQDLNHSTQQNIPT